MQNPELEAVLPNPSMDIRSAQVQGTGHISRSKAKPKVLVRCQAVSELPSPPRSSSPTCEPTAEPAADETLSNNITHQVDNPTADNYRAPSVNSVNGVASDQFTVHFSDSLMRTGQLGDCDYKSDECVEESVERQQVNTQTASGSLETASGSSETASGSSETASGSSETASGSPETASGSPVTASGSLQTVSGTSETAPGSLQTASVSSETASGSLQTESGSSKTTSGSSKVVSRNGQLRRSNRRSTETASNGVPTYTQFLCVCGKCPCPQCGNIIRNIGRSKQDSGVHSFAEDLDFTDYDLKLASSLAGGSRSVDYNNKEFCRCPNMRGQMSVIHHVKTKSGTTEYENIDLVVFIQETLNKNSHDRIALLDLEKKLRAFILDRNKSDITVYMSSSYLRMLAHRCAHLFQLEHRAKNYDKDSILVTIHKTENHCGKLLCTSFESWCTRSFTSDNDHTVEAQSSNTTKAKSILKRDAGSQQDVSNNERTTPKSKPIEQRVIEYNVTRQRIFDPQDNSSDDEAPLSFQFTTPVKLLTPEWNKYRLMKLNSWDSSPAESDRHRGAVSKSHSFGGTTQEEQQLQQPPPRVLSRQGDLASSSWRLSPSSSGYKTLSLRSTDSITPSPTGEPSHDLESPLVASSSVMKVSDAPTEVNLLDPKVKENTERRRGRLEKQQSFIENDGETSQADDTLQPEGAVGGVANSVSENVEAEVTTTIENHCETNSQNNTYLRTPQGAASNQQTSDNRRANRIQHGSNSYRTNHKQFGNFLRQTTPDDIHMSNRQQYERTMPFIDTSRPPPNIVTTQQMMSNNLHINQIPAYYEHTLPQQSAQHNHSYPQCGTQDMSLTIPPYQFPTPTPYIQPFGFIQAPIHQAHVAPNYNADNVLSPPQVPTPNYVYVHPSPFQCQMQTHPSMYEQWLRHEAQPSLGNNEPLKIDQSYITANPEIHLSHPPEQPRSVPYGPVDPCVPAPGALPQFNQICNAVMSQPPTGHHHMHFQQPMQYRQFHPLTPSTSMPASYPVAHYPPAGTQHNTVHSQVMIPPPYHSIAPVVEEGQNLKPNSTSIRRHEWNSTPRSSRYPANAVNQQNQVPFDVNNNGQYRVSEENCPARIQHLAFAPIIQEIQDKMNSRSTRDNRNNDRRNSQYHARRRNSGNGRLGNYSSSNNNGNVTGPPVNETHPTSSAASTVNPNRANQPETANQESRRNYYQGQQYYRSNNRQDNRYRRDERRFNNQNGGRNGRPEAQGNIPRSNDYTTPQSNQLPPHRPRPPLGPSGVNQQTTPH